MEIFAASPLAYSLLIVTILVSAYALFMDKNFINQFVFHHGAVRQGKQYHRIITNAFLHGSPMHLLFNMIALWSLGTAVEQMIGTMKFGIIYFLSHIASMLFVMYIKRNDMNYASLGASAAISGVVIAFALMQPFAILLVFIIPMPAIVFAAVFIGASIFLMRRENTVISHEGHLGGAVAGAVLILIMYPQIITQLFAG